MLRRFRCRSAAETRRTPHANRTGCPFTQHPRKLYEVKDCGDAVPVPLLKGLFEKRPLRIPKNFQTNGLMFVRCGFLGIFPVFDDVAEVTFQRGADAVQNVAVVTDNAVFIVAVYGLKFDLGSLGQLIPGNPPFVQIFVYC